MLAEKRPDNSDVLAPTPDRLQARLKLLLKKMAHGDISTQEEREMAELMAQVRNRRMRF
ncbi:hypothetical protein [Sphingopyxis sp. BSNA05]|uniref:hypothetical protein n=1 Tax=Sphingopyxis sp. BSNA05 TaxID=1236614 RepID=UPI00156545D4|nr:hypothetical protein [Sphingopyxis sp. BSNA05]